MINLEKSLKIGDELSGHLVFGHVDGLSKVLSVKKVGDSLSLVCELLPFLNNYVVNKGSISLNGVSLTINKVNKEDFKVNIVNHTKKHTTFKDIKIGDLLNVEIDMLARYVHESLR